jgi:glycosyltransferase involved in cell wall biosynthesis
MENPYCGLFEYCEQLGRTLQMCVTNEDEIAYYVPEQYKKYFGDYNHIVRKSIHKVFPARISHRTVWHTNYQLSKHMKNFGSRVKKTLTVHDLNFLHEATSPKRISKCFKILQNNIDLANHIVVISEFVKNDLFRHLRVNVPVTVIYNGCNVQEFPNYNNPVYRPTTPFLFSLGTVLPKKNFHVLPCLLKNNDYELIIAGRKYEEVDYSSVIMEEAKNHGVENRVKILGSVNTRDKYWYLKNCTAFMFPSLAEGFGIPPVEAMRLGKPTFLSTHTSLPEIGGEYAYYFNDFSSDNMQSVFEKGMNHYFENKMSTSIIKHSNKFNWQQSAEAYYHVFKSVYNM